MATFDVPQETAFRKYCKKRRKSWLPAICTFGTMFSTAGKTNSMFEFLHNCSLQIFSFWIISNFVVGLRVKIPFNRASLEDYFESLSRHLTLH